MRYHVIIYCINVVILFETSTYANQVTMNVEKEESYLCSQLSKSYQSSHSIYKIIFVNRIDLAYKLPYLDNTDHARAWHFEWFNLFLAVWPQNIGVFLEVGFHRNTIIDLLTRNYLYSGAIDGNNYLRCVPTCRIQGILICYFDLVRPDCVRYLVPGALIVSLHTTMQ